MQPVDTTYGDFVGTDMWNSKNTISEDCLYMNVWSPHVSRVDDSEQSAPPPARLRAVMVRLILTHIYFFKVSKYVCKTCIYIAHNVKINFGS